MTERTPTAQSQPEQVMGFFVPMKEAAFVTEFFELAFRGVRGTTVHTGVFNKTPDSTTSQNTTHLDPDLLPDVSVPELESPGSTLKKNKKRRKRNGTKWTKRRKQVDRKVADSTPNPSTSSEEWIRELASQLSGKIGEILNETTPKILIQYPHLPYPVPVHPEFNDIGVPRKVVQMGCDGVLTPVGDLMPM